MDAATVFRFIEIANDVRRQAHGVSIPFSDAESALEERYRHSERLAVYGTLAPGRSNHHILRPYGGTWTRGRVRGDLLELGWGAASGYPALRLRENGPWIAVDVLESSRLRTGWSGIDAFEGNEYCRVLAPVFGESDGGADIITVANLYEIAR